MSGLLGALGGLGKGLTQAGQNMSKDIYEQRRHERLEAAQLAREGRQQAENDRQYDRQRTDTVSDRDAQRALTLEDQQRSRGWSLEDERRNREWSLGDQQRNREARMEDYESQQQISAQYRAPNTFTDSNNRMMVLGQDGTARPVTENTTEPFDDYARFDENDTIPGLLGGQSEQQVYAAPRWNPDGGAGGAGGGAGGLTEPQIKAIYDAEMKQIERGYNPTGDFASNAMIQHHGGWDGWSSKYAEIMGSQPGYLEWKELVFGIPNPDRRLLNPPGPSAQGTPTSELDRGHDAIAAAADMVHGGTPGQAAPNAPGTANNPTRVHTQAEVEQLPSGTFFIGPDSVRRVKP